MLPYSSAADVAMLLDLIATGRILQLLRSTWGVKFPLLDHKWREFMNTARLLQYSISTGTGAVAGGPMSGLGRLTKWCRLLIIVNHTLNIIHSTPIQAPPQIGKRCATPPRDCKQRAVAASDQNHVSIDLWWHQQRSFSVGFWLDTELEWKLEQFSERDWTETGKWWHTDLIEDQVLWPSELHRLKNEAHWWTDDLELKLSS